MAAADCPGLDQVVMVKASVPAPACGGHSAFAFIHGLGPEPGSSSLYYPHSSFNVNGSAYFVCFFLTLVDVHVIGSNHVLK